ECLFLFTSAVTHEITSHSLHDALPIFSGVTKFLAANCSLYFRYCSARRRSSSAWKISCWISCSSFLNVPSRYSCLAMMAVSYVRSEEHTTELQSRENLV